MAAVVKVELDLDSEKSSGSPQDSPELLHLHSAADVPFTFVPVQTEIKVENDDMLFVEGEEEEITVDVTPIDHKNDGDENGVLKFPTSFADMIPIDRRNEALGLSSFVDNFRLTSTRSFLRKSLKRDKGHIVCNACGKHFKFQCDFKRHFVMHTGERDFECDECRKRFKLLSHLKMHIYRFHADVRPYACADCGKRYASITDLRCHVPIHSPERPHVCPACSKGFISAKDLRKHIQIHGAEKPFECDECKKKFLRRGHLEKHIVVVHTRKKHHDCTSCSKKLKFLHQETMKK